MADSKGTWGGARKGTGRPVRWRKAVSEMRPQHAVRAHPEEWELIQHVVRFVKTGKAERIRCLVDALEAE